MAGRRGRPSQVVFPPRAQWVYPKAECIARADISEFRVEIRISDAAPFDFRSATGISLSIDEAERVISELVSSVGIIKLLRSGSFPSRKPD